MLRFAVCECGRGAGKEAGKEGEGKEEEPRASQEDDRSAQELEGIISTLCHLLAVRQRQAQISKSGLEAKLAVHTALEVTLCVSQGQLCSLAFMQLLAAPCLMHLCQASASHASTKTALGKTSGMASHAQSCNCQRFLRILPVLCALWCGCARVAVEVSGRIQMMYRTNCLRWPIA